MLTRRLSRRGFTVIETLVFSAIFLLLTGCIVLVVQMGMRYTRKGTAYQDAQKQSLVSMKKITDELSRGTATRRSPAALLSSDHIIFATPVLQDPAQNWTYDGTNLLYKSWSCFYFDAANEELLSLRRPFAAPVMSSDIPLPPELVEMLTPEATDTRVVMARGVKEFVLNDGPTSKLVSIKLSVSVATGTDVYTTVKSQTMVEMPNL